MIQLDDFLVHGEKWLYNSLVSYKQDVLPDNFRLEIRYLGDHYENDLAGVSLIQLHKTLTLMDFPFFFIELVTTNPNIQQELEYCTKNYSNETAPITHKIIPGDFKISQPVYDSKCVMPWIHYYINPQGQIGPCCLFDENFPTASVNSDSFQSIHTSTEFDSLRKQMLQGKRPAVCSTCWQTENSGLESHRQKQNVHWSKYAKSDDVALRYLDIRISNKCNFMCRMCSGKFSNRIAQEERKIYGNSQYLEQRIDSLEDQIFQIVIDNVDTLEQVYFAGGEPLINDFHYRVLDFLRENNRRDIHIGYNTNLSILKYKNYDVLDYWRWFKKVRVGASLDLIGDPANYVRYGAEYCDLEQNYYKIKDTVDFHITSTLHLMNAYNLPKLHKHWSNIIPESNISFNVLVSPVEQQLTVLPELYKQELTQIYNSLDKKWQTAAQFMNKQDDSHLLKEFFRLNDDKDQARGQTFEDYFPEYFNLRNYA